MDASTFDTEYVLEPAVGASALATVRRAPAIPAALCHPEAQKPNRNLSARVMTKSASSSTAPRRAISRRSETDFTSSHFA